MSAKADYKRIDAETRVADQAYYPVRDAYRAGTISDAEYLAARKIWEAAHARWEVARAAAYPGT